MTRCLKYEFKLVRPLTVLCIALIIAVGCVAYGYFFFDDSFALSDWRVKTEEWLVESEAAMTELEGDSLAFEKAYAEELRYHLDNNIPFNVMTVAAGVTELFSMEAVVCLIMLCLVFFTVGADKRYGLYKLLFIRPISKSKLVISKVICVAVYAFALSLFFSLTGLAVSAAFNYSNGFATGVENGSFLQTELAYMLKQIAALPFQLVMVGLVGLMLMTVINSDVVAGCVSFVVLTAGTTLCSFPEILPFVRNNTFVGLCSTFVSRAVTALDSGIVLAYGANLLAISLTTVVVFRLKYREL